MAMKEKGALGESLKAKGTPKVSIEPRDTKENTRPNTGMQKPTRIDNNTRRRLREDLKRLDDAKGSLEQLRDTFMNKTTQDNKELKALMTKQTNKVLGGVADNGAAIADTRVAVNDSRVSLESKLNGLQKQNEQMLRRLEIMSTPAEKNPSNRPISHCLDNGDDTTVQSTLTTTSQSEAEEQIKLLQSQLAASNSQLKAMQYREKDYKERMRACGVDPIASKDASRAKPRAELPSDRNENASNRHIQGRINGRLNRKQDKANKL